MNTLFNGTVIFNVNGATGGGSNMHGSVILTCVPTSSVDVLVNTQTNPLCNGGSNGSIQAGASGGTPPYTFSINGGPFQGSGSFSNLPAGIYSITVMDSNGSTSSTNVTLTNPPVLSGNIIAIVDNICFGDGQGSIEVEGIGGTSVLGTYTYSLNGSPPQNSGLFQGLLPGTYGITIFDDNGCSTLIPATVGSSPFITINISNQSDESCEGANNGFFFVQAVGGTGGFTYSIDGINFQSDPVFDGLSAGNYIVTATDDFGCTQMENVTIGTAPLFDFFVQTSTDVSCNGYSDGEVSLGTFGGVGDILYSLDGGNPQGNGVFTGLSTGFYTATATDEAGCSQELELIIDQPAAIQISISNQMDESCEEADNGALSVQAIGGTGGFTYSIDGINFQSDSEFDGLSAGDYLITAMDASGCTQTDNVTIGTASPFDFFVQNSTNVSCSGYSDGEVSLQASGNMSDFTYAVDGGANQSNGNFSGLNAGAHTAVATDETGCSQELEFILNTTSDLTVTSQLVQPECNAQNGALNGSIALQVPPGASYTYSWTGPGVDSTAQDQFELGEGTYMVAVEDSLGCTISDTFMLMEPTAIIITSSELQFPTCNGDSDGSATFIAEGGTGPLSYTLGTEENSSGVFEDLADGSYQVMITDSLGCLVDSVFGITEPTPVEISIIDQVNAGCTEVGNGEVTVEAMGGAGSFSYSIDGIIFQFDSTFSELFAGDYTVTAMDEVGCIQTESVTIEIAPPFDFEILSTTDVNCIGFSDGEVSLQASGNTSDFTYGIDGGAMQTSGNFAGLSAGVHTAVATDEAGCSQELEFILDTASDLVVTSSFVEPLCNAQNGELSGSIELQVPTETDYSYFWTGPDVDPSAQDQFELGEGEYMVVVEDSLGCTFTETFMLTEPSAITIASADFQLPSCNGDSDGAASFTAEGGTGSYTYTIGPEDNMSGMFEDLAGGTYQLLVADSEGCLVESTFEIMEPAPVEISIIDQTNAECTGSGLGSVSFSATNNNGVFTYLIDSMSNTTGIFPALAAGSYLVTGVDTSGCAAELAFVIEQDSDIESELAMVTNISCYGGSDGVIVFTANGGTGTLTYTINEGEAQENGIFENLNADKHHIVIQDEAGCSIFYDVELTEPDSLVFIVDEVFDVSCTNLNDGAFSVHLEGGTLPYLLIIENDSLELDNTGPFTFENYAAGTYPTTILDANGCTTEGTIDIEEPNVLEPELLMVENASCVDPEGGAVNITAQGGSAPYTFSIDSVEFEGTLEGLSAGDYQVIITDANDCEATVDFTIEIMGDLQLDTLVTEDPACFDESSGLVDITLVGGNSSSTFTLGGETNQTGLFENLAAGEYFVSIFNEVGCETDTMVTLFDPPILEAEIESFIPDSGAGDGSITVFTQGGTPPYQYSIDGGLTFQSENTFSGLSNSTYTVLSVDANGCEASVTVVLTAIEEIDPAILGIILGPNPADDYVNIHLDTREGIMIHITILDELGRSIRLYPDLRVEPGNTVKQLDVQNLPSGLYVIEFRTEKGVLIRKLVIE